ncbi:TIGR02391 family protein [Arthrobacter sp. RAF14]|uniref:TIGR02391 family protein n=1 Tax=Arthrobacter sp. RAF14 TaxID=3233051 RepID=UPI003F9310EA
MVLSYDDVRNLPLPELSMSLLRSLGDQPNFNNLIQGFKQRGGYDQAPPPDLEAMLSRISDAWAWLVSHALIGHSSSNTSSDSWSRVTSAGTALLDDPNALAKVWADERLSGDLHPELSAARSNFALGDYETASFAAMKAVEVAVRDAADLPNELLGVALMRKAFSPKDGLLRDPGAEGGEQQAIADLFAGAIGAYKNPASHRTVQFEDAIEAAEVIQLADLLLRIVRRSDRRLRSGRA